MQKSWSLLQANISRLPPIPPHELLKSPSWIETKGFLNEQEERERIIYNLKRHYPDYSDEEIVTLTEIVLDHLYRRLKEDRKNPDSFAFLDIPLPKETTWKDLRIQITGYDEKNPKNCNVDIYLTNREWKENKIKVTHFHEMQLEDTVLKRVSISGEILFRMCIWEKFIWEEENIPDNYRTAKKRLAEDLRKFFGIPWEPLIIQDKEYISELSLGVDQNIIENFSRSSIPDLLRSF